MLTSSRKAKGRRLQQEVQKMILETFSELTPDDCRSTSMGASGTDVQLSALGKKLFPFSVEAKNQESLSIWKCLEQTEKNAAKEQLHPLLVFKRNKSKTYAALPIEVLFEILRKCHSSNNS